MKAKAENLLSKKNATLFKAGYWVSAGAALLFVFSNQAFSFPLRLLVVSFLLLLAFASTGIINYILIPKLMFQQKLASFFYGVFGLFCISLWLILLVLVLTLLFGLNQQPDLRIPSQQDVIILVFSSYLIIAFASVIHFIKESQKQYLEKLHLENQKKTAELHLKKAQQQLLQSQIHPHFIYNMLNSMYALTSKENLRVRKLILELSAMLDYMLYECRSQKVELHHEIKFLEDYISLESIRHEESFQPVLEKEIPESDLKIAPLLLFPFLENAFKHGYAGEVEYPISAKLTVMGTTLHFRVENPVRTEAAFRIKDDSSGIGLQNIRERLALLYPNRHKLQINRTDRHYIVNLEINLNENKA